LNDLFDRPEERGTARATRPVRRSSGGGSSAFLIAALASLIWIAAVAAFCWSRYSLPDNPGDAMDVVGSRISTGDWMLIVAAILGPLVLIWVIAWLMRRTAELKRQSQELASAALRLTQVAQTAEAAGRPLALTDASAMTDETPRHLRREVERATHAISALHSQMRAIEEALSTQARNIDDVAERAEKRARNIATTLRTEREALERVTAETGGAMSVTPAAIGAVGTGLAGAAAMSAFGSEAEAAHDDLSALDPVAEADDFTLDEARVEAAAESDAAEMLTDAPTFAREEAAAFEPEVSVPDMALDTPDMPDLMPDLSAEPTLAAVADDAGVDDLRTRLAEAKSNARWERPALSDLQDGDLADTDDFRAELAAEDLDTIRTDDTIDVAAAAGGLAIGAQAAALSAAADDDAEPGDYAALAAEADADIEGAAPFRLERRHSIDWKKFTRAANFPESEEDIETLDALYDVLTDPEAASLLQCAEDTLASLADIDLYMEDFTPSLVSVSAWQGHLDGSGSGAIDGIKASVEQSRIRAKLGSDKGFEHLSTKFMDRYEDMCRRLMNEAEDQRLIVDLSNTRTGRAYLMIAEPAGRLSA